MTRAILVPFHKYTPFGDSYYEPILNFFLNQMQKYKDEYDMIYILDSTWNIKDDPFEDKFFELAPKLSVIKVDPSLRYYDAYKSVLSDIEEELILFMDNDMVVYKKGILQKAFYLLNKIDVVTIMDTIGTWKSDKLKLGNKFCPYFFATKRELLMKYLDVDWSPDSMPDFETLGKLTKAMVEDGLIVREMEDDKSSIYFDGTKTDEKGKDLGYYHIRAGSTPAYLLATKKYGDQETYWKYLREQPKNEYLRQFAWYYYMLYGHPYVVDYKKELLPDLGITSDQWHDYYYAFLKFHNLI